jgi:U3 small nucleolar RNA-associated protein 5
LYQLIDERLSVFKPLLKLVGRMQMLQAQMASQAAASRHDGAGASDPLFTYDEAAEAAAVEEGEEEEEEDFDEGESDGEEEDDEDDLSDLDGLDEDEDEEDEL